MKEKRKANPKLAHRESLRKRTKKKGLFHLIRLNEEMKYPIHTSRLIFLHNKAGVCASPGIDTARKKQMSSTRITVLLCRVIPPCSRNHKCESLTLRTMLPRSCPIQWVHYAFQPTI